MFARSQILILLSLALLTGSVQADGGELPSSQFWYYDKGTQSGTITVSKNTHYLVCIDNQSSNVDPAWTVTLGGKTFVDSKTPVDKRGCKIPTDPAKAAEILKNGSFGNGDGSVTFGGKSYDVYPVLVPPPVSPETLNLGSAFGV